VADEREQAVKYEETCALIDAIPQEERDQEITGDAVTAFEVMLNTCIVTHKPGEMASMMGKAKEEIARQGLKTLPDDLLKHVLFTRVFDINLRALEAGEYGPIAWRVSLHDVARRMATIQVVYLEDEQDTPDGMRTIYQQLYGEQMIARRGECLAASHDPLEIWLPSAEYMRCAGKPSNCPLCNRPLTFPN
jgi:hypothetical protein